MKMPLILATLLLSTIGFAQSATSTYNVDNPDGTNAAPLPKFVSPKIVPSLAPPPKPEELEQSDIEKVETENDGSNWSPPTQSGGGYDVGIIPESGACPTGSERIMIYMDDEDTKNADSISGWTGSISQTPGPNHNTQFVFCRIDGRILSQGHNGYAVLSLGTCPNNSSSFSRRFINECHNNQNSSSGNISPNISDRATCLFSNSYTKLNFCYYSAIGGTTAFPDLGIGYGVFAASYFQGALATGHLHTDDEDNQGSSPNNDDFEGTYTDSDVIYGSNNTDIGVVKVSSGNGPHCTEKLPYFSGGYITATWDSRNCYIKPIAPGATPFIWNNAYYVTPDSSKTCLVGWFDSVHCYYMPQPPGGYQKGDSFYVKAGSNHTCSLGHWDGTDCLVMAAPWTTHAFVWNNAWYFTTAYTCKDGGYDGANCYIMTAPPYRTPFIYANNFYYAL